MKAVEELYDQLFLFESKNEEPYAVHKRLRASNQELLDLISEKITFKQTDCILDAGCGNGHSLFWLNSKYGSTGRGISLSREEVQFATRYATKLKKSDQLTFSLESYDEAGHEEYYDKVLAIESLKHSPSVKISISNLLSKVKKQGVLVVSDDFKLTDNKALSRQSTLWESPGFTSYSQFERFVHESQYNVQIEKYDLTSLVAKRSVLSLRTRIFLVQFLCLFIRRRNMITYLGGLMLELEYVKRNVEYLLIVIQKF